MLIFTNRSRKITALLIIALLVFAQTACAFGAQSETSQTASANSFSDLKSSHWGYKNIQTLVGLGGIKGYPDGTFKPEGTITYAELTSILLGATGYDNTVPDGNWAQGILQKAYAEKIVDSTTVPLANANKPVTRDKMAMILSNSARELKGESLTTLPDIQAYVRDWGKIGSQYQVYVNQAVAAGLIQGDTSSNFNAAKNLTRAEAATICLRLIDSSIRAVPTKYQTGGGTTSDGYTVIAEGTNISDYVKDPGTARLLTGVVTGTSEYKVLDNGNKFGLTLVKKSTNWFMIQYTEPGAVYIIGKDGKGIDRSQPHTTGEVVKQPWAVDLSQVKYFVFYEGGGVSYIVPNTLQ